MTTNTKSTRRTTMKDMENAKKEINEGEALAGFCTEENLLGYFGIKKATLDSLRYNSDFPFVRIDKRNRLYYLPDVRDWLMKNRRLQAG